MLSLSQGIHTRMNSKLSRDQHNIFVAVILLLLLLLNVAKRSNTCASPMMTNSKSRGSTLIMSLVAVPCMAAAKVVGLRTASAEVAWKPLLKSGIATATLSTTTAALSSSTTTTAISTASTSLVNPADEEDYASDDVIYDDVGDDVIYDDVGDDVIYDDVGDDVGVEHGIIISDNNKNNNDGKDDAHSSPSNSADAQNKNLSSSLDEQISRMFEMKMMPRVQHDGNNSNSNNNNNNNRSSNNNNSNTSNNNRSSSNNNNNQSNKRGNSNRRDGQYTIHYHDELNVDDPILEKIVSIKWMNNNNNNNNSKETSTTTTPDNSIHYDDNIPTTGVHGDAPGNDAGVTRQNQPQQQHHHHHQQHHHQQQQHDSSSKYDHLQQQLFEVKIDHAKPHQQTPVPSDNPGVSNGWKSKSNKLHRQNGRPYHNGDHKRQSPTASGTLKRRLPQAIIIGVKKAGTRALLEFLRRHPMVKGAGPEVHFFDKNYHRGLKWYRNKMPPSSDEHLTIEKTPAYFINKMAPMRIQAMNNNTRLLLVVRNPVNRLISHYAQRHSRKPNMSKFEVTVVKNFPYKKNMAVDGSRESVQQGLYAKYLHRWLRYFPLEQIAIIDGENLVANPYEEVSKLESFLGLSPFFTPNHFVPNASRGFPCFRSVKRQLIDDRDCDRKLSPEGSTCEDLSVDGDEEYDDEDKEEFVENESGKDELESPITTIIGSPSLSSPSAPSLRHPHQDSTVNQDGKPLSYGNAFHILSLPNVSMYFPNQMVPPLPSPQLAADERASSYSSSQLTYGRKKRDQDHHHHHQQQQRHHRLRNRDVDLERSRGNRKSRKQNQESLPIDGEEPIAAEQDHHHHQQQRQHQQQHHRSQRLNKIQSRNQQQQQQKKTKSSTSITPPSVATPKVKDRLHCLNEGKGRVHPKVDDDVITLLGNFYRPHNERFFKLVGRRFHWS